MQTSTWLLTAAWSSLSIALLHAAIIVIGPPGYAFFGAPDLARSASAGSPMPALMTSVLVLIFAVWAWYAFAAAGVVRREPPLLRLGLWAIGALYFVRGIAVIPELVALTRGSGTAPRFAVFSAVSLAVGIAYLVGAWQTRRRTSGLPENAR